MAKQKNKNFIDKYENEIKEYRENYYKNLIKNSKTPSKTPVISFYLIPIFLFIIILLITDFSIIGYIISFLSVFATNYLLKYLSKVLNLEQSNEYLETLKRNGYHSIEEYEAKVKKYITGPNGYYQEELTNIINKYKLDNNTRKVVSTEGEEYFYWVNSSRDKMMLLNCKTNKKPEVKTFSVSNIRYYRIDNVKKSIIINTSTEVLSFKQEYIDIFTEFLKEKKLENLKSFTPATYIDDFEIYVHGIRSNDDKKNNQKVNKMSVYVSTISVLSIILCIIVALSYIIKDYSTICNIASIIILIIISSSLRSVLSLKIVNTKTDDDYLKQLNNDPECIERFTELKYVLGIKPNSDRVYTLEGAEYQTWLTNGYFHVFLNLIYFNIVYMSVKLSDVAYYKVEGNECIVKLKDKTLSFTKDAEEVFRKILPNKDYYWLKGYQNK